MEKIRMDKPLVEMDGDEMTRVLWQWIKEKLLHPFIDLKTEYYDLGLPYRDKTDDKVTVEAAEAIRKYGVGVKCATITPNEQRRSEYNLKRLYPSPNATLRAHLDGTIFRTPILSKSIRPYVPAWTAPITVARHAYGDIYKAVETKVTGPARAELVVTYGDGSVDRKEIHEFQGPGILMGMHNTDKSIYSFARACMTYALSLGQDLWFATKDTISKIYDHRFKDIFQEVYDAEFADKFTAKGISYQYMLIDDSVARVVRSGGGFVWAMKNYDGDVLSDMVASAMGSLSLMSSVLVSPEGFYEYEAAHGTVTRHYYKHLKGEETGTNSVATIYAWSGALARRGLMDDLPGLVRFGELLEKATMQTIEEGVMTGDLVPLFTNPAVKVRRANSLTFIEEIASRLAAAL